MRTYLITYNWPLRYRGSYLTTAEDGIKASDKIKQYLHDKYGVVDDNEVSQVSEVYDNGIQVVA